MSKDQVRKLTVPPKLSGEVEKDKFNDIILILTPPCPLEPVISFRWTLFSITELLSTMEPWAAAKKTLLVWRCHQLLSGFLAKGHLPRVSRQSRRSLMIRVIMKWSRGCALILSGLLFRDNLFKTMRFFLFFYFEAFCTPYSRPSWSQMFASGYCFLWGLLFEDKFNLLRKQVWSSLVTSSIACGIYRKWEEIKTQTKASLDFKARKRCKVLRDWTLRSAFC